MLSKSFVVHVLDAGYWRQPERAFRLSNLDLFRHDFVLSIRPEYATRIVEGLKTVELRRRFPFGTVTDARLYVYATVPTQAVIGYATIDTVEERAVEDIWERYQTVAYIDREAFDAYFRERERGYVIRLRDPVRLAVPVTLAVLKEHLNFTPPQSFAYADDKFQQLILG